MQPSPTPTATNAQLVLIVEDEATLAQTIELYLRHEGYRTERAADGQRGIELFRAARPDLVLLDLGLPKVDGSRCCARIRAASDVPVVILTAREEEVDELLGLGMGADDYLVKPVSARKLLARVKVALRRARPLAARCPRCCAWDRSRSTPTGSRCGARAAPLDLTPSEFKLVQHMARTPGRVIERAELYEAALPDGDALERAVDIHVVNLRRKLRAAGAREDLIRTVRGRGYVLEDRAA
jgi:two-component system, OmpR family, response regulator AdeR